MSALQANLFAITERGRARRNDPATSKAAAKSVDALSIQGLVMGLLIHRPDGMTTHEMADALDVQLVSISPRMTQLREKNLMFDSGERRDRSIIWRARAK